MYLRLEMFKLDTCFKTLVLYFLNCNGKVLAETRFRGEAAKLARRLNWRTLFFRK